MARLIAEARASPETRRVLVAAAEGENAAAGGAERPRDIVALMAVTTEGVREDARVWAETHDLAAYDDFAKPEEAAAKKAEAAAAATENAGFGGDAPAPADPPGSSPPPAEPEPDEPDEPTNPATLEFTNPADGRTRTNDAFRVTAFASLPGYERETRPLLDAAFARFPEVDFCVARVPADAEEVPFTTHEMVRVPPCSGMRAFAEHVLYARHREADAPGFHVRPGAPGDAPGVASCSPAPPAPTPRRLRFRRRPKAVVSRRSWRRATGRSSGTCSWTSPWMCAFCARASAWTRRRTSRRTAPSRGSPRTSSTPCSRTGAGAPGSC